MDRALKNGLSRRALMAAGLCTSAGWALGRIPYGGALRFKLPWPTGSLDPHAVDDAAAELFGAAITDTLYAVDASDRVYPALAAALPEPVKGRLRIPLRPNLMTARRKGIDARDVLFSLSRAAKGAAAGVLEPLGAVAADPQDAHAILVSGDATAVARALSAACTAILPRGFSRLAPDGTGAFLAEPSASRLVLRRNPFAARGAAFLDRIEVDAAKDLTSPLRAFESGETDASWLGEYLHRPRPGALRYQAGSFGWIVLLSGQDAGAWGAPGVVQRLLDAIPPARLTHLGLTDLGTGRGSASWSGEPGEILVADDSPHLQRVAEQLAAILGRPGHELRAAARPRREIEARRRLGRFTLALDFARRVAPGLRGAQLSLLAAVSAELARRPPQTTPSTVRQIGASLPLGVVGELTIAGAHVPALIGVQSWDLGAVWRRG